MQLEHEFTVPVPVAQAWDVLLDVERIAPCMPGATVESFDGETVTGRVKVKVGPIQVTYAGTARFVVKDVDARRAVIDASATEARGSGTAKASITAVLLDEGPRSTRVTVTTDLAITGKPAQFGRGVMAEVGNKLLGRFADCLAAELGSELSTVGAGSGAGSGAASGATAVGAAPSTSTAGGSTAGGSTAGGSTAGGSAGASAPSAPSAPSEPSALAAPSVPAARSGSSGSSGPSGSSASPASSGSSRSSASASPSAPPPVRRAPDDAPVDLLEAAGLPILKRAVPLVAGLVVLVVLWRLRRRRR